MKLARSFAETIKLFILAAICAVVGCRAKPAPDAGFLTDTHLMKKDPLVPYNRIYVDPQKDQKHYTEIYVAPVNTDHLLPLNIWEMACSANLFPQDVEKNHRLLADYDRNTFIKAMQKDPSHRFKVVDQPGPDTLILEMALVQIVPCKAALNDASYFTWIPTIVEFVVPVIVHSEDGGQGVIALEARLRDGSTGKVVGMFADREHPPMSLFSIKASFWWEPIKPMMDGWARQFVAMENGRKGKENKPISMFEIIVL